MAELPTPSGSRLALIVAVAENGVIGRDNQLPFRLRKDLQRFRRLTLHHVLIMGRATWESIGRPLPKRRSIVLTRNTSYSAPGAELAGSLEQALELARAGSKSQARDLIFVVGGARVYEAALPLAHELFLTRVHAQVEGDVYFPKLDLDEWQVASAERTSIDEHNEHETTFFHLRRTTVPEGRVP